MRQKLAPILFDEDDEATAQSLRRSTVAPAQRSPSAESNDLTRNTEDALPVGSFQGLLEHLATLTRNRVQARDAPACEFYELRDRTVLQGRAFELLGVTPGRTSRPGLPRPVARTVHLPRRSTHCRLRS